MNEAVIIISVLAILFSLISLIVGCVAISMVCGFLRSTHTVTWKPLDVGGAIGDEGEDGDEEPTKPKDFGFMEDVAESNNY